jgi:hypothetical protein
VYVNGKMRTGETTPGMRWGRGMKENDGGVNSIMIYCKNKNFYKCHIVLQYNEKLKILNN